MAGKYEVTFMGNLGNLAAFSQSIKGAFSQIRSSYRASAASPVSTLRMPNLSTGNITTQIDAYNRTLIQSGQVFHRYVAGYTADLKRLDVAAKNLGVSSFGGSGMGFGRRTNPITGASSYSTYGTDINKKGKAVVRARPIEEIMVAGQLANKYSDLDKVMAAQAKLAPLEKDLAKLEKAYVLGSARREAKRSSAIGMLQDIQQDPETKALLKQYKDATTGTAGKIYTSPTTGKQSQWLQVRDKERDELSALTRTVTRGRNAGAVVPLFKSPEDLLRAEQRNMTAPDRRLQGALREIRGIPAIEAEIQQIRNAYGKIERLIAGLDKADTAAAARYKAQQGQLLRRDRALLRELDTALKSTAPIPRDLDMALSKSKDLRREFARNLGVTAPYAAPVSDEVRRKNPKLAAEVDTKRENFSKALIDRGITPDSVSLMYDFEKGTYRLRGSINGLNGTQGEWSKTLDKNFKGVERMVGGLRRTGGFLQQTGRDFQKVLEWTIATTVVFGTFGMVIGSMSKINQVNKDLVRFGLTAQTTGQQTKQAFSDIADIAYKTATPLQEMTAVMDDIALATRRSTQTSEQWRQAINSLAEAVGILTNLTGIDTVRATDLLSSAYKQLAIQPSQLISVLNKVTAVAGGNAQAIEDIVAALGSVSEAAKAARLTLDEQISSVQVLSQVTNKSASDLATSFKNLFGSISSPGSVKVLEKFNIAVRDSTGNLRPFLQIYKDIYDARQSGRIGEGQLQDVLRGISGGPRRAPDAAALLESMPLIYEQIGRAATASNEALLANARVLETNAAKMQQLRNAFDEQLVNAFTDSVNKLVAVFYSLGKGLNSITGDNSDSGGLFGMITQLGLMAIAAMGAIKIMQVLKKTILSLQMPRGAAVLTGGWTDRFASPAKPNIPKPQKLPPIVLPPTSQYSGYTPRPRNTWGPYLPPTRPVRPVPPPSFGQPQHNYQTPLGAIPGGPSRQQILRRELDALRRGQPVPVNPNISPSAGLVPLRQQLKEEIDLRKSQLQYTKTYLSDKLGAELGHYKDVLAKHASFAKTRILEEGRLTKFLLVEHTNRFKESLAAQLRYQKDSLTAQMKYRGSQVLGSSNGRIALGALAGGAVAGGVAAAATSSGADIGAISSLGQAVGAGMLFSGAGPIMAAGAAIIAVSTALNQNAEAQQRVIERSKEMRASVLDNTKVLAEQRKVADEARTAQQAALDTIKNLSTVKKLDKDQTEQLAQAQKSYVESTFKLVDANTKISETITTLIDQLPKLGDAYARAREAALSGQLSPKSVENLQQEIAKSILTEQGYYTENKLRFGTAKPGQTSITRERRSDRSAPVSADEVAKWVQDKSSTEVLKLLNYNLKDFSNIFSSFSDMPGMGATSVGYQVDQSVLDQIRLKLDKVPEEQRGTPEFQQAVERFGQWVSQLDSPKNQLAQNVASNLANIQSKAYTGLISGEESTNQLARGNVAKMLQGIIANYTQDDIKGEVGPGMGRARGNIISSQSVNDVLFGRYGEGGFATKTGAISAEEARSFFSLIKSARPEWQALIEGSKEFDQATYTFFERAGYKIDELATAAQSTAEKFKETIEAMNEGVDQGKKGLYDELLNLRAQKMGGEYKGREKDYTKETDQLNQLISAYDGLNAAVQANIESSDTFIQALSTINGLEGLRYENAVTIVPALINVARTLGLTGDQIKVVTNLGARLATVIALLDKMQATPQVKIITSVVPSGPLSGAFNAVKNTINTISRAQSSSQNAAQSSINNILNQIKKVLAAGAGTSFSGGGSSGGGGSSASIGSLDVPEELKNQERSVSSYLKEAVAWAKKYQAGIPGETKAHKKDQVAIMIGNERVLLQRGIAEEYLRKSLDRLTEEIKKQNELMLKTDKLSRIRVGAGTFAAIANVPVSAMGISTGGPGQPINVNLNVNGQILTPAQLDQLANLIAAQIKRGYSSS